MLKIDTEAIPRYGDRLRVSEDSMDEYEWIIDHLGKEIRGASPNVYGRRDNKSNRNYLKKLFKAHGIDVIFTNQTNQ
jgi:hypothetical protein